MLQQLQILNPEEVTQALEMLEKVDFSETGSLHPGQNNIEAVKNPDSVGLGRFLIAAFNERHKEFRMRNVLWDVEEWLMSKTGVGEGFKPHIDNPRLGHISMSIFLNDDYEGGELEVREDGETKIIKPKAGTAAVYSMGMGHRVAPVTKGTRYVMVCWLKSFCEDPAMREILGELTWAHELMQGGDKKTHWDSFEEAEADPRYWMGKGINSLLRIHAPYYH